MKCEAIRGMEQKDLRSVVDIHFSSFQGFFLTFLGTQFLRELYCGFIEDDDAINFVYEKDEKILGFVCGSSQPSGFYRRLIKHRWLGFAIASVPALLKNPLIISRLLRAFSKPTEVKSTRRLGTLMSIAVLPECQGMGVGEKLVKAFLQEASGRDLQHVNLTTDKNENDAVNHFYTKMGFSCVRSFTTPEGRMMNEYEIRI